MFENVKGFQYPVVAGVLGASREIYALGLQTETVEGINRKWDHALGNPIPPRIVKAGPVQRKHSDTAKTSILPNCRCRPGPSVKIPRLFHFTLPHHQRSRNRRAKHRHLPDAGKGPE